MWSSVAGLALLAAMNLVRIGLALLVISRPRPVQNLLALAAGCLTGALPVVVLPLVLLHVTSMFDSFTHGAASSATDSNVRHVQMGMGALALAIAAVMTVRSLSRRRQRARQLISLGVAPAPVQSTTPPAISRLLGSTRETPIEGGSLFRRLLRRGHEAWDHGSLWVAYVIGIIFGGPPPGEAVFLFAIIVTSETGVGAQIIATMVYFVGMLAVMEVMLVGYVATPTKTQALMKRLHDWALAHRRGIVVGIFAVVGVAMVARGIGSI